MTEPTEDDLNGDLDLDWDSEGAKDRGPERPVPKPLGDPEHGPPAPHGDLTTDPDEPTSDVPGDYLV